MLLWMLVIFSPFFGFYLQGRVNEAGLLLGCKWGLLPLAGLIFLKIRRRLNWSRLPQTLKDEYRLGKVFPAADIAELPDRIDVSTHATLRFSVIQQGVSIEAACTCSVHSNLELSKQLSFFKMSGAPYLMRWDDIEEWVVVDDMEGSGFHRLELRGQGRLGIERTDKGEQTLLLLDYVRAVGRLPVRICCDL